MITEVLLPASALQSGWFAVLSTFVALNTVVYVTLAIAKLLPRPHPSGWFRTRDERRETRSIDPDAPI